MSDKTAEYVISAEPAPFEAGINKAVTVAKTGAQQIAGSFDGIGSVFKGVMLQVAAVTAVLAGGKFFSEAVEESTKLTGESVALSKALGITTEEASTLNVALGDIYSSSDTMIQGSQMLAKQLKNNEAGLKAMGLQTRDTAGNLLPMNDLMMGSIEILNGYQQGTDRTLAAQSLFGKGAAEIAPLLKINNDLLEAAKKKQQELGLAVGQENVEALKAYKASMNDVGDVVSAIKKIMGDVLLPILTQLGDWFSASGPAAVGVFKPIALQLGNVFQILIDIGVEFFETLRDIFNGIAQVVKDVVGGDIASNFEFWKSLMTVVQVAALGLKAGIVTVFEVIRGAVLVVIERLKMFAAVAVAAFNLDWDGVKSAWKEGSENVERVVDESQKRIVEKAAKTGEEIQKALLGGGTKAKIEAPEIPKGKRFEGKEDKPDKDKFKAEYAVVKAKLEGELAIQKEYLIQAQEAYEDAYKNNLITVEEFYAAKNAIDTSGVKGAIAIKEQELKQTLELEARAQKTGKQSDVLGLKAQELRITSELTVLNAQAFNVETRNARAMSEALQKKAQLMQEIQRVSQQQIGTAEIERERILIEQKQALGEMSDAQAIEAAEALQERLYQIDLKALQDKQLQFDGNLDKIAENNAAIEQLERTHQQRIMQLKSQATIEQNRDMRSAQQNVRSSFEGSIAGMLEGTMSLRRGMQTVWNSILQSFSQFVSKKVSAWVLGENVQTGATVAGNVTRTASNWMAAAQSVAASAWAAVKNIAAKAWEVAASVYSALASIPYVGPFIAPVAAIAATGAVLGFASHVASAEGGYDIPAGVNPMTQLHEREMVLPAKHADAIRSIADDGGKASGGNTTIHIHSPDALAVKRLFENNAAALVAALKKQGRNGGI